MKIEKFKVLLYLKKSGMDKNGKAPIMGRITVNRTMAHLITLSNRKFDISLLH